MKTKIRPGWRIAAAVAALAIALVLGNGVLASCLLWKQWDVLQSAAAAGAPGTALGTLKIEAIVPSADGRKTARYEGIWTKDNTGTLLKVSWQDGEPAEVLLWNEGKTIHAAALPWKSHFVSQEGSLPGAREELQKILRLAEDMPFWKKCAALLALRPWVTGWKKIDGIRCWTITSSLGEACVGFDGWLRKLDLRLAKDQQWQVRLARSATPEKDDARLPWKSVPAVAISAKELDASLAASLRIATLRLRPPNIPADGFWQEGEGWLKVQDGIRMLSLHGAPFEIGRQHGALLADSIRRLCDRLVYGVGFYYSLRKGTWFPDDARRLVERQKPYIDPAYVEEMKGLAQGAELPLDLIQAANIFPEFFHCSGAVLRNKATADGGLLHVRVLDYMSGVGIQDEAVTMAVARPGTWQFVSVGYAGFVGSVTGMNQKQIAIGEMGGRGEGDWDGVPMSFLIRGALEHCSTLEEARRFFAERPRTCEYYYLISDGKTSDALGVAATPKTFVTFGPGEALAELPDAVPDTVLISGKDRYCRLVERVKADYGKIDVEKLTEIIKRPVAMKSNLHNVVFQPQKLRLWIAHASRDRLACDRPYHSVQWADCFPEKPLP